MQVAPEHVRVPFKRVNRDEVSHRESLAVIEPSALRAKNGGFDIDLMTVITSNGLFYAVFEAPEKR